MSKYQYTKGMRELSGMGGSYEAGCRAMVVAGLEWFDAHPAADPRFHGYSGIYGVISEDNQDAKDMVEAMMGGVLEDEGKVSTVREFGPTGAMVQCTVGHVLRIRKVGWDSYAADMLAAGQRERFTKRVLEEVGYEREDQFKKWGEQNHNPDRWLTILTEEVGESAEAALTQDETKLEKELVQVAAVAVAAIESLRRNRKGAKK